MQPHRTATDAHHLAEERSIAYHRAIAARLRDNPALLDLARARVRHWLTTLHPIPRFAAAWDEILARDVPDIATFLVDPGEWARELRQSSPFAGALSPRERWQLWRETRSAVGGGA